MLYRFTTSEKVSEKRASLSLMKYEIIKEVDKQKTQKAEIARQRGIPKSTLFTILKMREDGKYSTEERPQGAAEKFAMHDSWRFRSSFARMVRTVEIAKPACDPKSVSEWLPLLQNILIHYQPRDGYIAVELGMFYNLMADCTLAVKGDMYKGTKKSKERLTTLLCCNVDGSDKMKPLTICKFKKPRGFRENILPYDYNFNKKAWMTSAVFTRWLRGFDTKMGATNRKIVLFVDNCPTHPELDNLRKIELVFLPKNTPSMLQPLDQVIIQQVILRFWEMLVWRRWKRSSPIVGQCSKKPSPTVSIMPISSHQSTKLLPSVHVFLAAASSEDLDDPPLVDAEPQPGPSTVLLRACLTATQLCDKETWGCRSQVVEEGGEDEAEEPAQVSTSRDILKAGDVDSVVLRRHSMNEEM
ncbi:hypothetical protein PR048_027409 [Dryococelus australis]|uniref:HTH psq-type domain-containing protein n=1 Tax=Dryococelus australis TaxID=614101 RepID=A0ABQ9GFD4_9NEOP|nr:hypothetical protein PR048_027409 [Dryococelus australis]